MKRRGRLIYFLLILFIAFLPGHAAAASLAETHLGDEVVFGGVFRLSSGETLEGSLVVVGGSANLEEGSRVTGQVVIIGGNLAVNGTIDGSVFGLGGLINIYRTALIRGDVTAPGSALIIEEGAAIFGEVSRGESAPPSVEPPKDTIGQQYRQILSSFISRFLWYTFRVFALSAAAMVVVLIWPEPVSEVSRTIVTKAPLSGGVGLIALISGFMIALILAVMIVFIPVSFILLVAMMLLGYYGWIALGLETGVRLASLLRVEWPPAIAAGIGTLLLTALAYSLDVAVFSLACVGWIPSFVLFVLGLGGVLMTFISKRQAT